MAVNLIVWKLFKLLEGYFEKDQTGFYDKYEKHFFDLWKRNWKLNGCVQQPGIKALTNAIGGDPNCFKSISETENNIWICLKTHSYGVIKRFLSIPIQA